MYTLKNTLPAFFWEGRNIGCWGQNMKGEQKTEEDNIKRKKRER
jgi:hypothetical protein